jgi:hypothetical protein
VTDGDFGTCLYQENVNRILVNSGSSQSITACFQCGANPQMGFLVVCHNFPFDGLLGTIFLASNPISIAFGVLFSTIVSCCDFSMLSLINYIAEALFKQMFSLDRVNGIKFAAHFVFL